MVNHYGQEMCTTNHSIRGTSVFGAVRNQTDLYGATRSIAVRLRTPKTRVIH